MKKVIVGWRLPPGFGVYSWCVLDAETGKNIISFGHRQCYLALEWCDSHGYEVTDVDDRGTRR